MCNFIGAQNPLSAIFQGSLSDIFRGFKEYYRSVSRVFKGNFKVVSRVFKEFLKGVSRKFQGCFNDN